METSQQHTGVQSWYAARTRYGQEIGIRDRLAKEGIEYFIPTERKRNYRGKEVEHPLFNNLVFLRTTKKRACELKVYDALPLNYVFDYVHHVMLTVPDKEMEDFRRVLESSIQEGGLVDRPLALGDRVRVTRGPLKGVEGNVLEFQGKLYVVVGLMESIFAKARIPRAWLAKADAKKAAGTLEGKK